MARVMGRHWFPFVPVEHIYLFSRCSLQRALTDIGFVSLWFQRHWKVLPFEYVYRQFGSFGPEIGVALKPLYTLMPARLRRLSLPFYGGEMLVGGRRGDQP
jgi:hypothetical protein